MGIRCINFGSVLVAATCTFNGGISQRRRQYILLISKMATTKLTKRIKSFDCFIPIEEGTSKRVHLQILEGDIITENIDAVVVFKHQLFGSNEGVPEGDSLRILHAAGDGINDEYATAKAEGGRHVVKGVVLTKAGGLSNTRYIIHLMVNGNPVKLRETLDTALRLAEKLQLKSISFPPLPHQLQSVTNKLLEYIDEFIKRDRPICLHFIQLVVSDKSRFYQIANTRQRMEFDDYKKILIKLEPYCGASIARLSDGPHISSTEVVAYRYLSFRDEIHAKFNNVFLHVTSSKDFYTTRSSTLAYVLFREALWFNHCLPSNVDTTFPDMQTSQDITYSRIGNHILFEIALDDRPGKFIRVKSAIQTVLRYADEHGIQKVIFPSYFNYGNHQIELDLKFDEMYDNSKVIPLLYFQAISDYALYCRPFSLCAMHIYFLPQLEHVETDKRDLINALHQHWTLHYDKNLWDYKKVMNQSPFRSIFTTMQIDSLFQACHLSIVHETFKVKQRKLIRSNYYKTYQLEERKTYSERYTYDHSIGNILPVQIPIELLLER